MPGNFYDLLGVADDATEKEIKAAYREMAREYHPDVNDDDRASDQFKTVRKAYEVLSDASERRAYDRLGHETYVEKRLDGLPNGGVTDAGARWSRSRRRSAGGDSSPSSRSGAASSGDRGASSQDGKSSNGTSSGRTSSASSRSSSASSRASSASNRASSPGSTSSRSRGSERARSSRSADATGSADSAGSERASAGAGPTDRSNSTRTGSAGRNAAGSSGGTSGTSTTSSSTSSRGRRNRASASEAATESSGGGSPLRYGWTAVLLAAALYAAGLLWYLRANAGAAAALSTDLVAEPVAALAAPHGLTPPASFARAAALSPSADLLFPVGALALSLTLAVTVYRFGRGTAWLYVAGGAAPLVALGAGSALPAAAAVDLLLAVVCPLVAALAFLGDVGRFLFSPR